MNLEDIEDEDVRTFLGACLLGTAVLMIAVMLLVFRAAVGR